MPVMLAYMWMMISKVDAIGEVEMGLVVVLPSHGAWCIAKMQALVSQWRQRR